MSPMHTTRSLRKRLRWRSFAAQAQPQLACLEVRPSLSAESLACINRIADASAAKTAAQPIVELRHALFAVRTVEPWPLAAEMHFCPRDPNALWDRVASEVKQDCVSGCSDLAILGHPSIGRNVTQSPQRAPSPKLANVQAVAGQLLDREGC